MTAPFVWDDYTVMTKNAVLIVGPEVGSTKVRAMLYADLGVFAPPPAAGTLWQRAADRADRHSRA